ncbi:hypothetical protein TWF281_002780 [Arthrobotrys megalospora]
MPPAQHTFGVTGNAPSYPGAGATQMPQSRPMPNNSPYSSQSVPSPVPGAVEVEAHGYTSPIVPGPSVSPNPYVQNPYAQGPHSYGVQSPQEPVPAYTPYGPNESPDLLAARREYLDVEAQIQNETTELNHRLNNRDEDPTVINSLQDSVRKLYIRKGALMQRIQDLQDPNSYAFQQSQAMTAIPTHQTPLMYDEQTQNIHRANILANYTVTKKDRAKGLACIIILVIILTIIIVGLITKKKR